MISNIALSCLARTALQYIGWDLQSARRVMVDESDPNVKAVLEEFERASDADKKSATAGMDSFSIWLNQNFGNATEILAQYGPALLQLLRALG